VTCITFGLERPEANFCDEHHVAIRGSGIKVFHRLWFDNPKRGKAAVSALRAALPFSDARKCAVTSAGRSPHWLKVKNPTAPAVKREAGENWN
jgi:hypothetical protein